MIYADGWSFGRCRVRGLPPPSDLLVLVLFELTRRPVKSHGLEIRGWKVPTVEATFRE